MRKIKALSIMSLLVIIVTSFSGCYSALGQVFSSLRDALNWSNEPAPSTSVPDPGASGSDSMVWEVIAPDGSKMYMMGSIHSGVDDMYPLSQTALDRFDAADALAVENDIIALEEDSEILTELAWYMMYLDGTTVEDHISAENFEKLDRYLDGVDLPDGYTKQLAYMLKPIFISSLIEQAFTDEICDSDMGIDRFFLLRARDQNKKIVDIEDPFDSYIALSEFSDEYGEEVIADIVSESAEESKRSTQESLKKYLEYFSKKDSRGIMEYLESDEGSYDGLTAREREMVEEYNRVMLDDRNDIMADRAEEFMESGETYFYIVGIAHLAGETGLIQQLRDRGYEVTLLQ